MYKIERRMTVYKIEQRMTVVSLSRFEDLAMCDLVEVCAENFAENLTFTTNANNMPKLGAKITLTIEEE